MKYTMLTLLGASILLSSCNKKEETAQQTPEATKKKTEKQVKHAEETIKNAAHKTEQSAKKTGNALLDATHRVGEKSKAAADKMQKDLDDAMQSR
jgi:uncharacterized lipoprotein YajG